MADELATFWTQAPGELLTLLRATDGGLSSDEARRRLVEFGANRLQAKRRSGAAALLLAQFKSPITLILIASAGLAAFLRDPVDAAIILLIVGISALLGFWQEHSAAHALEKLWAMVQSKATVLRDGGEQEIAVENIVPGDVVLLSAGAQIPADCRLLDARDLFVDEAPLTGETFPAEKQPGVLAAETPLAQRTNTLFFGTHVVSGTGRGVVVRTGRRTEFGAISDRLQLRPPETDFEHGIRRFGYFLMEVTLLLVVAIFAVNVFLHRSETEAKLHEYILEAFLFSLALAVGLTPQLLPAIISVNLSHGARRMAERDVIVKRLASIENFGSMDVLCSDKTGTLTEGTVNVLAAVDVDGAERDKVFFFAYLNAKLETGFNNPIDNAIRSRQQPDISGYEKLDEIPYDFVRKRLSIFCTGGHSATADGAKAENLLVTKGALNNVLAVCAFAELGDESLVPLASVSERIRQQYEQHSAQGHRVLGVAYRKLGAETRVTTDSEAEMVFLGFLILEDPPKAGIVETLKTLRALGILLKMITGDNQHVARNIARQVGLAADEVLTGPELRHTSDEALVRAVDATEVFAEIEPNQKERIILALKKAGHVVGYLGDGINDASALHAADVGISVDSAVDVAKEAADIVLLKHDLSVLLWGVREGRITFANTLKYVFMATSANFGNMFSMAVASVFLPFLPLLPKQVLLTNLLTDLPEMMIAADHVDEESIVRPQRWDLRFIRNFMLAFGTLSSLFDLLTFAVLLFLLRGEEETKQAMFRTGWFIESVISASLIVLVIRTRRPFLASKPHRLLAAATAAVVAITLILPYTPLARLLGFHPVPPLFLLVMASLVALYVLSAELLKRRFYRGSAA